MALTLGGLKLWLATQAAKHGIDDNTLIVMSNDAEGNSFSPLAKITPASYHPLTEDRGEIYHDAPVREENDERCIVLWPEN